MTERESGRRQISKITKAFSTVVTRSYHQTQKLSMTENNFLFLIRQKMQFLKKVTSSTGSLGI